ncbi:MAG: sulfatase-like hydrolase/transferase [Bacteroidota bacterium]
MALIIFPLLVFNSCKSDQTSQDFTADVSTVTSKPNIVFFLIDDIGVISTPAYSANMDGSPVVSATQDTGYVQNGGSFYPYTTSNINRLASESLVFTKMYATPLCAPSRGQLMTGLYPFQTGIVYPAFPNRGPQWDFGPASPETPGSGYLNPDFTTYPKMLRDDGDYYTGFGGKWNLRWGVPNSTADHEPFYDSLVIKQAEHLNDCGFTNIYNPDAYTALIGNTVDYYPPQLSKDRANNEDYFPYSLNAWALDFLDDAKSKLQNDNTPYYLHYCAGLIHDDDYLAIPGYPSPPASEEVHFANKIHVVDSLIGVVIDKVKNDPILSQNTIIIVAGDNGTEPTYTTKYRGNPTVGGKFSTKTYGSNVPFIVNWPDTLAPGTYTQLADFADVHSTMTNLAGIDGSSVYTSGVSFLHNMKLPPSSRSELRSYIYSQANGLNQNPNVPSCPGSLAQDAFIANQEYSLIPSSCGGALFKINPTTLQDSFLCTNGCTETDYEDAYCTLYTELITLAPPTEFVPYDNTYKCSEG